MAAVAFTAAGAFVASMALLSAYERTKSRWLGWAESLAFLAMYLAFGVLVLGLHGDLVDAAPAVIWTATVIGTAGVATCLAGQLATLVFGVPFQRVAIPVTIGFMGILLWIGGASVAAVVGDPLPSGLGWLGVATIGVSALVIALMLRDPALARSQRMPTNFEMLVAAIPFAALVAWLVGLGVAI